MAVKGNSGNDDVMAEINVTPLTDVLLVLLIIFMVTATAITSTAFNIKLPKVVTKEEADVSDIVINVTKDGDIFVGSQKIGMDMLPTQLAKLASKKHTSKVVIKADTSVQYGLVIRVMDSAKKAGLTSIALANETVGGPGGP
ncbi:MAG: biopolymer transporter ExbD [Firmicutes bacterium]|nr:biopolymer transporter ExbD [Bacillota bacterium]